MAKDVTISQEEYENLLKRDRFLSCLEGSGVDNWDGYDFAIEMMEDSEED